MEKAFGHDPVVMTPFDALLLRQLAARQNTKKKKELRSQGGTSLLLSLSMLHVYTWATIVPKAFPLLYFLSLAGDPG